MSVPHPIPYQGSKRGLARAIIACFPDGVDRLIEPFAGSAAVTLAAAHRQRARTFALNDANAPLMHLWDQIITQPDAIAERYARIWEAQFADAEGYYNRIRDEFNRTHRTDAFLFLLARCVKASVRYNANGDFNQSPDNRRNGTSPATMRRNICGASALLKGRARILTGDYRAALDDVRPQDLVYLDPPYQGVCGNRDLRYIAGLTFEAFVAQLRDLNAGQISYIVSYDGRTGEKEHGKALPADLDATRIEIDAGRSSQATLLGRNHITYESLYLSPALVRRLGGSSGPGRYPAR